MEQAERACEDGENTRAVRLYADAYLAAMQRFPAARKVLDQVLAHPVVRAGLTAGSIRNAPFMWPRYGAKLHADGEELTISIDRKNLSFSETVQYQEFMYDFLTAAQSGEITFDANRVGPAQ
jgi:hypothetical protein